MKTHIQQLTALNACRDGLAFAHKFDSLQEVWDTCERGEWLLWLLGKKATEADRKNLVLIACECARLALPYTKDPRVLACIETVEKWTRGDATIEQVREARRAAYADAGTAAAASAADAAYAAASAADAAAYAVDAAAYASAAAYAADAAAYAAYAAARKKTQKQIAAIVRKYYPQAPTL
jgi:hypothetical protein